ncbi:MAG TPA: hypothetical protein VGQ17_03295, partial [Gemmatimonadales bacterium]|nr:hypothetical protein [Gemmatimonadales bacterium]
MRSALVRAGLALGLATVPAIAGAQKALVYCPTQDQTGCNAVVTALSSGGYLAVDRGFDGTGGTVDLRTVDLFSYNVFVVPSLADDATTQPYGFLRNTDVEEHLKAALIGGLAVWSGTPDQGSGSRTLKDQLIRNLASWAGASYAQAHGPGLVALLDLSENEGARYDWLRAITPLRVTSDVAFQTYDSVKTLTSTGSGILTGVGGQLAYPSMAALGFATPTGTPGLRLDAHGATGTTVGGQIVLATLVAGNTSTARIHTDRLDYAPGDTVTMIGSGWAPGETVTITLHEDPLLEQDNSWTVVADGSGNFTDTMFAPDQLDLGTRFVLTADGGTSGMRAQATFTDAGKFWAGCLSTVWTTAGNWASSAVFTCTGPGGAASPAGAVPAAGDDVTIPTGLSNYPTISSGAAAANDIIFNSGATLTVSGGSLDSKKIHVNAGASMTVSGGSVTHGDDNVVIDGALTITSGSIDYNSGKKGPQGSGTITQSGGLVKVSKFNFSGTYNATGGTTEWTANGDGGSFSLSASFQFFNVLIDAGVDPKFENNAVTIKVAGNWTNNSAAASLTGKNTTVELNG